MYSQEEYFNIGKILGLNAAMLLFGFMAEYDVLDRMLGFVFRTIAFVLSYYYTYINYVEIMYSTNTLFIRISSFGLDME